MEAESVVVLEKGGWDQGLHVTLKILQESGLLGVLKILEGDSSTALIFGTRTKTVSILIESILHCQASDIKTCFWNFIFLIINPSVRNLKIIWNNHL
ncbi:hypothetical protein LXL04_003254 [Taraxacum kok-saghyz]